ncbi:MAG TPA: TOBE domain-containing protein [Xanthobacteraceae bacterium]|nr:TOBE domain-containing protein [Xanthobacteraceae bacterium]
MKISPRNIIPGTIVAIKKGVTTSHVRRDIGTGNFITSPITNEAVDDLKLAVGGKASAIVKSSEVMIAVD